MDCEYERTRAFYEWEIRGRGRRAYARPVPLEPVFIPFAGHSAPRAGADDLRKPTFLSTLAERFLGGPAAREEMATEAEEPEPGEIPVDRVLAEFDLLVPVEERVDAERMARLVRGLTTCHGPVSFEMLGSARAVRLRMACDNADASLVRGQVNAFFPAVGTPPSAQTLEAAWEAAGGEVAAAIEFALAREFMIPLRQLDDKLDPLTPIVGALARVASGDLAVLQVLFEETTAPWRASVIRAVTTTSGEPFFADAPEVTDLAAEKLGSPLHAVVVRLAARCNSEEAAWEIIRSVGGALAQYGSPDRNEFVPLASADIGELARDILARRTRRSGMLLSLDELAGLVRLPDESLRITALVRDEPQEALPAAVRGDNGIVLGEGRHRGADVPVVLPVAARLSHVHVIGASGTGKSTLLQSMILQDIASGAGVGVLDPHGDLVDAVLARMPAEREADVILFDPADPDYVVGWNILGARSEIEKELLASDLVAVFKRLSTSWGDQMTTVLGNAVLAFLESSEGGTLQDLRKFLLDDKFRDRFLGTVRDPHVAGFWRQEFQLLVGKRPQAPILTRLDTFLRSRLVRDVVTEREEPVDFRGVVDSGKVFLAKLSQGAIGEENAALVGALLVSKFHQVSLSRQDIAEKERRPFFLYIDEFHTFATPSMASLFSGVRKYRLGLTVAHQDLYQLHASVPEVERAILANAYTRIAFRVSDEDARKLERGFADFTSEDLGNLATGQALCRVGRREDSFRLRTRDLARVSEDEADARRAALREKSMNAYGRMRRSPAAPAVAEPVAAASPATPPEAPAQAPLPPPSPPKARQPRREKGPVVAPPEPGRGGPAHKYLQSLIKQWGEAQGFKAEIEKTIDGGKHIDIALSRDQVSIAVEIAMTTTLDWEVGNVEKALACGYAQVVVVSLDAVFLRKLSKLVDEKLAGDVRSRVQFFSPEEFFAFLETQAPTERVTRVAGYKVSVRTKREQAASADARKKAVAEVLLKSVRRLRTGSQ